MVIFYLITGTIGCSLPYSIKGIVMESCVDTGSPTPFVMVFINIISYVVLLIIILLIGKLIRSVLERKKEASLEK